ncbi:hypothetical protein MNBD_IGNAVI01-1938 [hydrothermal vent metagenome]|uniref:Glycosyltransferase 2-like domain-containing protein n=1 Tax=hydrothermal vent metagenome TaxID=652676 RepID=A0A3B1BAS2_9ZZZZ
MTILFAIIFLLTIIFLIYSLLIYSALNKLLKFEKFDTAELMLSVVVAAKNEAENIPSLISTLRKQSYPADLFEVIIVDDNSSDNTFEVAKSNIAELSNFKVIRAKEKKYPAKKGALDIGIRHASNPYIVITDADCTPSPDWLRSFASKFSQGNEFVFGIAPYRKTRSFVNRIAAFENLRAHMIMFAFAKLGFPYSAAARSFGFSVSAFEKIKGYENTTETLSGDDDLLLREAAKYKLTIGLVTAEKAFVFTDTKRTYKEYKNQKLRHTSTSHHYSLKIKILMALWHISNIVLLLSAVLTFYNSVFFLPVFLKLILDLFLINMFQNNFGYKFNLFEIILLQIIYEIQLIYFFILAKKFSAKWQ